MSDLGLYRLLYAMATVASAYDGTSHLISLYAQVHARCLTNKNAPACRANWRTSNEICPAEKSNIEATLSADLAVGAARLAGSWLQPVNSTSNRDN